MSEFKITKIQVKRANAATWTSQNPFLDDGEFGFERDTNKLKIGNRDVPSRWNDLPYLSTGSGSGDSGFTEEQIQDIVNTLVVAGPGISKVYDDSLNRLTLSITDEVFTTSEKNKLSNIEPGAQVNPSTGDIIDGIDNTLGSTAWKSKLTTEEVQDIMATSLIGGTQTNISVTYNDSNNTFDFFVSANGGGGGVSQEEVEDIVDGLIQTGNGISKIYNDASGTLTISLSGENFTTSEKNKLSGIEAGASADQSPAEIKAAYESSLDTNAFTDAEKTKLGNVPDDQSTINSDIESRTLANDAKVSYPGDQDISGIATNASAIATLDTNKLESTDLKTINGESIVGSGDIEIISGSNEYNNIFRDSSDSGLTGAINGTNTSFTVSNGSYNPGTLNVFVEGQLFTAGHGVIETTPATGVFTFENAPETGTSLYVTYQVGNTVTDIVDGSIIESKLSSDVISNFKNTPNGYVSPREYNSIMDGVTDDRDTFESTLIAARAVGKRVIVDRDIFLDVSETSSSIILESGDWIEGINGANIIVNNLLTPAFLMVLTSNITFKNINIVYDQTYDATVSGSTEDSNNFISFLNNYLVSNRGITLTNSNFGWTGRSSLRYTFMIDACEDILFDNVTVKSKGETADKFMIGAFKLKWEWAKNSTITSNVGDTSICKNITFKDIILDGYIMGIQGVVDGFKVDNFKAYRYSDVQTASGTEIGGTAFWMAPPHLFYLNTDASPLYNTQNVEIRNTIDYGILVGSNDHRSETSGYCTSLKMINTVTNVYVDNYTSLRRDGLGEIQDMSNATYKNIYSESEIGIFDSSVGFNAFRFLGTIENVHFENVTLKDKSTYLEIYPLDLASGNNSSMTNFNVIIEGELNTDIYGCYGISGSNNKITNSFLKIGNHTSTQDFRGVIYHDNTALLSGANNHYEVIVQGWRDLGSIPSSTRPRVLLASALNPNNNYAKLVDISNNYVAEQVNGVLTGTLIKSEIVTLGTGTSQALSMVIPTGFALDKVVSETITALNSGTNVTIGTDTTTNKANLIANVYETTGKVDFNINENSHYSGNRSIYINSDTDFASSGVIKVTIELKRYSETSFSKSDNVIANVTDNSVTTSKIVDANVSLAKLSPSVQSTLNQAILSYETLEENEILVVKSDGTIEGVPNFTFTGALLQVGSTASGIYSQLGDNTFSFARNADSSIRQIGGADINFQTQNSSASNTTRLKIEGGSDNGFVELYNSTLKKNTLDTAPANSSATGTAGEVRFTATGVYICIATNSWINGAGTTF